MAPTYSVVGKLSIGDTIRVKNEKRHDTNGKIARMGRSFVVIILESRKHPTRFDVKTGNSHHYGWYIDGDDLRDIQDRPGFDAYLGRRYVPPGAPEPPPIPNDQPAVWPLVIADMQQRHEVGIARYGVPLQPFNGRRALKDAYEETLDQAVYLRQAMVEDRERRQLLAETLPHLPDELAARVRARLGGWP